MVIARHDNPPARRTLAVFNQHPPGLQVCFAVELWERFSFYGMQSLLIFYLTRHLLFPEDEAYLIYGAYAAMVYMAPVVGGWVADRYLGARKAVTLGALLVTLGHFTLAFEGLPASRAVTGAGPLVVHNQLYPTLFFVGLSTIVIGVSFVKTSCTTLVGALYGPNDPRRDSGFTLYYMGINIGGVTAPLLCGWVASAYGFGYGFGLAGIGMLIGLYAFRQGQKHLLGLSEPPVTAHLNAVAFMGITREWAIYAGSLALIALVSIVMRNPTVVGVLIGIVSVCLAAVIIQHAFFRCDRQQRRRLIALCILLIFSVGFWAFYQQTGSSMMIFADRYVDRTVLGYDIPASMLPGLPAALVLVLAPLFSILWLTLARRGSEPSTTSKFAVATVFLALGFLVVALGIHLADANARISSGWLVLNFTLFVMGELCLAPMAPSMVTKLAPRSLTGLMIGCLMLSYSASSVISSLIARLMTGHGSPGYAAVYTRMGLTALAVSLVLFLLRPLLERFSQEAPAP
jgi:POT family proton-dependent oligopeptide transporter